MAQMHWTGKSSTLPLKVQPISTPIHSEQIVNLFENAQFHNYNFYWNYVGIYCEKWSLKVWKITPNLLKELLYKSINQEFIKMRNYKSCMDYYFPDAYCKDLIETCITLWKIFCQHFPPTKKKHREKFGTPPPPTIRYFNGTDFSLRMIGVNVENYKAFSCCLNMRMS